MFSHQIEDDKMNCEPIGSPNNKMIQSKIFLWKLDLYHLQQSLGSHVSIELCPWML